MNIEILFEDDELLLVNKPPGIVVNKAESVKGQTVADWVWEKRHLDSFLVRNEDDRLFADRAGIAHRIDKETSGILVIAKTPKALLALLDQFKERLVKKTYLALVHGALVPEFGEINAPVGRLPWNRERFGVVPGGKEALTRYQVKGSPFQHDGETLALVEVYPQTGRTHQIRVHFKYINHPLVGDYLYAGRKVSRADRQWAPRVMLHAWKLSLIHPTKGNECAFEAPVPDDMMSIIDKSVW